MSSSPVSVCSNTFVFGIGDHKTQRVKPDEKVTPKPLLIFSPLEAGEYPVVVLLHGFLMSNSSYSQLSYHVASHGFILVVPQLDLLTGTDATKEVEYVAEITNWLPQGLPKWLPSQVNANLKKLALSGHSRGGKVAFALALNKLEKEQKLKYSALIGIDPVDGMEEGKQTLPKVLTYSPRSFNLNMPVMVIGSGLGEVKKQFKFEFEFIKFEFPLPLPASAPKGLNHEDFYKECCKPACYFVAKDYGHCDMLDDEAKILGIVDLDHFVCGNDKSKEPMRRFVGGAVVSFLKAYLEGDFSHLMAIKDGKNAPVELQKVDFMLSKIGSTQGNEVK